jgi:hypothetical protein
MTSVAVISQTGDRFSPLDPAGMEFFYWDFTRELKPGETIVSAVVVSNSAIDGSDNSAAMVSGSSIVMNGNVVKQMISGAGGASGVPYVLKAKATTNIGQVLPLSGILNIGPEFGVVT